MRHEWLTIVFFYDYVIRVAIDRLETLWRGHSCPPFCLEGPAVPPAKASVARPSASHSLFEAFETV